MLVIAVWINIVGGLCLEALGASRGLPWLEDAVGVATCAHLLYYFMREPRIGAVRVTRAMIVICLALATFGELVLSAVWGLYLYRQSVLPLFVPPGHVLLFLSGL